MRVFIPYSLGQSPDFGSAVAETRGLYKGPTAGRLAGTEPLADACTTDSVFVGIRGGSAIILEFRHRPIVRSLVCINKSCSHLAVPHANLSHLSSH